MFKPKKCKERRKKKVVAETLQKDSCEVFGVI